MTEEVPVTQARVELSDLVSRVAFSGERVTLTRHGKVVAALVSVADLARLEDLDAGGQAMPPPRIDPVGSPGFGIAAQDRPAPSPAGGHAPHWRR